MVVDDRDHSNYPDLEELKMMYEFIEQNKMLQSFKETQIDQKSTLYPKHFYELQ